MPSLARNNHSFLQSALRRYLLATLLCLLLHLPFLLFRQMPSALSPLKTKSDFPPIVCMRGPQDTDLESWEKECYLWADIADPTQLVKPNPRHGFTAFGFPKTARQLDEFEQKRFMPFQLPYPKLAEIPLSIPNFDLSDAVYNTWNSVTVIKPAARTILPVADGVTWRFASGTAVKNAPVVTEQALALARRSAGLEKSFNAITEIEIIQDGPIAIPRVIVRKSCGQPAFDKLALHAIRRIMLFSVKELQEPASDPSRQPSGNYTLMAIWHLHPLEEK